MITVDNIRAMMIKNPNCSLWDKSVKFWTDSEKKIFNLMLEDKLKKPHKPKEKKLKSGRVGFNIIRVSDGKVYTSMADCRDDNNLYCYGMLNELRRGINFKRI